MGGESIDVHGEKYRIEDFRRHDKFNIAKVQNDICLLKLEEPIPFSSTTFPICLSMFLRLRQVFTLTLSVSRRSRATTDGNLGSVAGWGDQSEFGQLREKGCPAFI